LAPHLAQAAAPSGAPHSEQNLPELMAPQDGHFCGPGLMLTK
jgi:hypothetical protein